PAAAAGRGGVRHQRALPRRVPPSHRRSPRSRARSVNFAREGLTLIAIAFLVAAGAFAVALARRSWPLWLFAIVLVVVALWVAYFFRDPERLGARGAQIAVAPADGRVVQVTEVDEPTFIHGRALRVSIFMNVFD